MKYIAWLIVAGTILFNLVLYFPETTIKLDPNDNIFQFALVQRTSEVWDKSSCPLSLSCIPNLIDHWVPNWAEGYPLPYYYSHLPQIAVVTTYKLIFQPLSILFGGNLPLHEYYNWTKYLLLAFFPLPLYIALRLIGVRPLYAALGTLFAAQLSTDGLYGIDPPSYVWRGYGLTSQLYSTFFIPLAIACTYRALEGNTKFLKWAVIFTTLSIAGHLGMGVILLLTLPVFLFIDFKRAHIFTRIKRLTLISGISILLLSYWIIPAMLGNTYHLISFWDPVWKFNSYGFIDVLRQYFEGELFDWKRLPIITILVTLGTYSWALKKKYFPFALAFVMWILLYFGRATWGGLIDLIPGMEDFHQSRFIVGIHIAGIFLIPAGIELIVHTIKKVIDIFIKIIPQSNKQSLDPIRQVAFYVTSVLVIGTLLITSANQTIEYTKLNTKWINESNLAYEYQKKDYTDLLKRIDEQKPGRIYAGRPGNWGRDFRFSSTQMYLAVSLTKPISQFLPESWSPNSDNEQMFDERVPEDYNLYNLKYIITDPSKFTPPSNVKKIDTFGQFHLYSVPTTGYFDIISSNMMVNADKTNLVNIIHLWQKSFVRLWNMHPLITLENQIPPKNINRTIQMTDISNFKENGEEKNIFEALPFSFPDATISGKIIKEEITPNETYVVKVEVPKNCSSCFTMFKMTYHPNWKVILDGKEVEKYATFPFFIAIPTSPGTHTLEFQYKPNTLKILLLVLEIVVLVGVLFRKKIIKIFS